MTASLCNEQQRWRPLRKGKTLKDVFPENSSDTIMITGQHVRWPLKNSTDGEEMEVLIND